MIFTIKRYHWVWLVIGIVVCPACRKEVPVALNIKRDMLAAVNALRSTGCSCGNTWMPPVKPLHWNDTLADAALAHARDMKENRYFSHISPNGNFPIQRAIVLGYAGNIVMENIAKGFTTLETVMEAWQKSDSHCKAIMDGSHTEMGAASVNTYWVQEFGSYR